MGVGVRNRFHPKGELVLTPEEVATIYPMPKEEVVEGPLVIPPVKGMTKRNMILNLLKRNPRLKYREIATQLGTTESYIWKVVVRARRDGRLIMADRRRGR